MANKETKEVKETKATKETKVTKARFVSENPYKWIGELSVQFRPDGKADGGVFETDNKQIINYLSICPDVRRIQ